MKGSGQMKKITFKKINRKKVIRWVIILLLIAAAIFYFVTKSKPTKADTQFTTAQAVIGTVESSISGKGTLNPADQYEVKSLVKGEILSAPFEEGDSVNKGQLLYQISTSEIENSIKTAELNVDKAKLLYQETIEKQTDLSITAKESGYIKKLYVKEGASLQPGTAIADIYNNDTMYLDLLFPSYEVKNSWIGKSASITMEATGEIIKGKVSNVSNMEEVIEGGVLAKKVTISVKNSGGIKAGDLAEATVSGVTCNSNGSFRVETETTLTAETSGTIAQISVKEGQFVKKGATILTLSSKDLSRQIETADISIREAELTLDTQKKQMEHYTITAPISGKVITKNKKQGDTIDPTADAQAGPMAIIYDMGYLKFDMNIDELQISNLSVGQKVSITTDNFPGASFEGVLEKISLKGVTNNGITSYPVTIKVEKYDNLLPGMNVTGNVIIEKVENVLTIPSASLQRDNLVYVQSEGAAADPETGAPEGFKAVTVEIGINDGVNVEIKSGLKEGETVYVPYDNSMVNSEMYW
jgi:HlyD family secretion protein